MVQTLPLALNYWAGNQFVPAPVNWAPTPKPAYAAALEQPSVTGAPSPAQQALGVGPMDAGFQGGQPTSAQNVGLNAVSPSFGSFLGSALTGPATALPSFGIQAVSNALAGNPNAPINGLGMMDAARSIAETLGIGGGGMPGSSTLGSPQNPGPGNPSVPGLGDGDNPFSGGGAGTNGTYDGGAYGPGAQEAAEAGGYQGSGMYSKGGKVTTLFGPNPPGPDDGYGGLDKGEHVVKASEAKKHRGLLNAMNKGASKKKLKGLLGG